MSRPRRWCFTLNNPTKQDEENIEQHAHDGTFTYVIFGREKGTEGTAHLQGYFETKNGRTLGGVKKLIARAHFEPARGSPQQNRDYCSKESDIEEWGTISNQGARNDLSEMRKIIQTSGSIRKCLETTSSYQAVRMAEKLLTYTVVRRTGPPTVLWLNGKTGSGKTRCAWELSTPEETWAWNNTKWFDGYDGHKTVILDDYRGDELPFPMVLRITDRYPHRVEVKGGFRPWNPELIIFTSPNGPRDCHRKEFGEELEQLIRRITFQWDCDELGTPDVERIRRELNDEVPNTPGED